MGNKTGLTAAQRAMYEEFMVEFSRCAACWFPVGRFTTGYPRTLENAHIVGGAGRRHERWAILRLCKRCHDLSHGARIRDESATDRVYLPSLSMANLMWLKRDMDPDHYDPEAMNDAWFRRVPDPEIPDTMFFKERVQYTRKR